ncbi:MAG: tRNA lysidine(34) synthetase TilS [Gemmiger sp.]|nr:tRNA lysidine(34) synthetase TilS [Gemmiger sp.]
MAIITDKAASPALAETEQTLLAFCRRQGLFKPGDRVIAACSGGADSVALLSFLLRQRCALQIEVLATHVNHGIRGATADADAAFVADFCAQNGVELFLYDARQAGVAIPAAPSEDWARKLRYAWFDALAQREEATIATAHTLSDQAETLLLRLARGTGLHGMAGIPVRRGPYARPCLCLTRAQTEGYCAALGQSYVQDETNAQAIYARNRLRQEAIPALQSVNPAAEQAMGRFCAQMQVLDGWFTREAAVLLQAAREGEGYDLATLRSAEGPVLNTALHSLISAVRDAEEKYVDLLRFVVLRGEGALQLTDTVCYRAKNGLLFCVTAPGTPPPPAPPQPFAPGIYRLPGGFTIEARLEKYEEFLKNATIFKKDLNCCADYAKIQSNVLLRTRQAGDFFRPAGRSLTKTLKKLLNEDGVPPARRGLLPLLARQSEVLWLWGYGFAEGYAPDAQTRRGLVIQFEEVPS